MRMRKAAKSAWTSRGWWHAVRVEVAPVIEPVTGKKNIKWRTLACAPPLQCLPPIARVCLIFLVRQFSGDADVLVASSFEAKPDSLVVLGTGGAKCNKQKFRGAIGSFATVISPPHRGKVVRVIALTQELQESGLASSLHSDKSLVFPDTQGRHCWHAVRVYLRSRLRSPESVCERWGSLMHMLWDSVCGWGPHRVVSRLFIRESEFIAAPSSRNVIVKEVADFLFHRKGMNPYLSARFSRDDSGESEEESDDDITQAVRVGMRENPFSREWWRDKSCPSGLLPEAETAVSAAMARSSTRGALQALPLYRGDKEATPSVKSDALADWLRSDEAASWRLERQALFPKA